MSAGLGIIGLAALVPAILGGVAQPGGSPGELLVAMCQGGTFAIPLEREGPPAMPVTICCAKGCHRRGERKLVDPEQ
ncbi:hypothetical protein [Aurantiacibacter poecillastricola]|uniref:hypothetical protein n=1 Tax=Aurantiacibacter poecillastricola TaxID=3064385 RepID=UPI00273E8D30|nr:hypothetical protein [Aurantiacibacter sp. 219JJ12-13]MDP5261385.1 hypothetical protein [Aurantiacibacter sp. 219JJ12-13]